MNPYTDDLMVQIYNEDQEAWAEQVSLEAMTEEDWAAAYAQNPAHLDALDEARAYRWEGEF